MTACPDPVAWESYLAGTLPPDAVTAAETHLDGCPACAALLERASRQAVAALSLVAHLTPRQGGAPAARGYELIDRLGEGGMGEVWRPRQLSVGREVAVKFIARVWVTPQLRDRFRAEAEAVARLSHPNVVAVYEFDLASDRQFFSMELVGGGSLADALKDGAWPADRAARLVEVGSLDGAEEAVLDVNELATGEKFMSARVADVCDDGTRIISLSDTTGFREYMLSVKDLTTGRVLEDKLVKAASVTWAVDGRTLFYVTEDAAKRAHKLWRHAAGRTWAGSGTRAARC